MSKYYVIDIDDISDVLILFDSKSNILLEKKYANDNDSLNNLEAGDKVLGYCKEPISEVKYGFEVIEKKSNNSIVLRKLFDVYNGCKIDSLNSDITEKLQEIGIKENIIEVTEQNYNIIVNSIFTITECSTITNIVLDKKKLKLGDNVKDKYNRILFGAPGTGKSHKLNKDIEENQDRLVDKYTRVTFHPNYTYAQFVGSYKPVSEMAEKVLDNGTVIKQKTISYKFVPGPFLKVLIKALKDETIPQLLVIEEINRANPAAVFGDVFQLLDRNSNGKSCYTISMSEEMQSYVEEELGIKIDELYIPSNMYIWASMNSADQGVYPMDSAFKRRWSFEYIGIDENEDELIGKGYEYIYLKNSKNTYGRYKWNTVRKTINKELRSGRKINEDKLLGPFFLSETELSKSNLKNNEEFDNIFKSKVLMYLYEDIVKHKNINIFTENTLSEIMNAYDEGKVFTFEIECEQEKETMKNESPQVVSEDKNKLYSSHSAAEEGVQYNIEG